MGRRKRRFGVMNLQSVYRGKGSTTEAGLRTKKHDFLLLPHPLQFSFHRADPVGPTNQGRQWASADGCIRILQVTSDVELNDVVVQTGVKQFELDGVLPYPAVAERALRVGSSFKMCRKEPLRRRRQFPVDSSHGKRNSSHSHLCVLKNFR